MPLTIWTNFLLSPPALDLLQRRIQPHRLLMAPDLQASNLTASAADPALATADVAFGQPDPTAVPKLPNLRWIHLTTAGYERYDTPVIRQALAARGSIITNSSSVYAEPCAQHALAMILALARRLPQAVDLQHFPQPTWPSGPLRAASTLIGEQTILFLGFGAITRRLVELLSPMAPRMMALRRTPRSDDSIPTHLFSAALQLLPLADHVVDVLPASPETRNFVNASLFSAMKPTANFYNIGRGSTVDQPALLHALQSHRIAAAYLDVTTPEPLPPSDPLWTTPNCYITPHTAGGHSTEQQRLVEHFLANLARFQSSSPLLDRILVL